MGKALYEGILLETNFAPFFAAALLRQPVTLDDLPSLDADLHRRCGGPAPRTAIYDIVSHTPSRA